MKYTVVIEEHIAQDFEIEANSPREAVRLAETKYRNSDIVLESVNVLSVKAFVVINGEQNHCTDIY